MNREEQHAEIDRRSDAMRDQIEQGDWQLLEQLLAAAPEAQRREFYTACGQLLLGTGATFMRSTLAVLAAPLQDAVALGIAERVDLQMSDDGIDWISAPYWATHYLMPINGDKRTAAWLLDRGAGGWLGSGILEGAKMVLMPGDFPTDTCVIVKKPTSQK